MILKEKLMTTLLDLVSRPGISGTESENLTSERIYELLSEIEYFKVNPQDLVINEIKDDRLHRKFVAGLLRSEEKTSRTLIITGHLDVVGVEEFGHLKDLAFNPIELTKRIDELLLDEDSKADLASGEWLFGRGVADMKFGIALGIELIRELSKRDDFMGNILFLAVPSEETNSEGMLGAVSYLADLKEDMGLDYIGLLLPEPFILKSNQDKRRLVHIGACGKIMPMFFFVGKETHVSNTFGGVNPNLLASEVNRLLEANTDFCQSIRGTTTPAPTCLKQTDLKDLYSVQTPIYAASYYNLITLNMTSKDIIERLKAISYEAFESIINRLSSNRLSFEKLSGDNAETTEINPCVMTFEELYREVYENTPELPSELAQKVNEWTTKGLDNQTIAINLVKEVYERYRDKKPTIIIGFAPPYYPDRYPDFEDKKVQSFVDSIDRMIAYSKDKFNEEIIKENFFLGISDLSYTGLKSSDTIEEVAKNMPGFGLNYTLPIEDLKRLDITGIVVGPYGKDLHKYTERINIPFSFEVIPELYEYIIYDLFNK